MKNFVIAKEVNWIFNGREIFQKRKGNRAKYLRIFVVKIRRKFVSRSKEYLNNFL